MNKHLLLSRIKGLIFALKSSTEHNINFIYHKKKQQAKKFSSLDSKYVSKLAFVFKLLNLLFFLQSRK